MKRQRERKEREREEREREREREREGETFLPILKCTENTHTQGPWLKEIRIP